MVKNCSHKENRLIAIILKRDVKILHDYNCEKCYRGLETFTTEMTTGFPLSLIFTYSFRLSLTPVLFTENSPSIIHTYSAAKTNLKSNNSYFENTTFFYFLLGPIKLWGGHLVKMF